MTKQNQTTYQFFPWAREGLYPTEDADPITGPVPAPGRVGVQLSINTDARKETPATTTTKLDLYGPGEVIGIDHRQIVRTDPEPETTDFEPNYFPVIEFDRPDLPWLFSPAAATTEGKLRPWLCLVVVRQHPDVTITADGGGPLPILRIGGDAHPAAELPDLRESYAWAHVQLVQPEHSDDTANVHDTLRSTSVNTLSRLVAPRRLQENERYYACLVPTFEPGVRAGMGQEPYPGSGIHGGSDTDDQRSRVLKMAWDLENPPEEIELPIYYQWEFTTSSGGDFESLVHRLNPATASNIGIRAMDVSDPGPASLRIGPEEPPEVVDVEGMLRSTDLDPDTYDENRQETLRNHLNAASALAPDTGWSTPSGKPVLGPPIYGQWPPGAVEIPEAGGRPAWLRDLNVDPRYRVVAAYGTQVVQEHQEQLMASAWDQIGEVQEANNLLRYAQFGREATKPIYDTFDELSAIGLVLRTAPVHSRVLGWRANETVSNTIARSRVPHAALDAAFRRLTGPNGALGRAIPADRRPKPTSLIKGIDQGDLWAGDYATLPVGATAIPGAQLFCNEARERIGEAGECADKWNLGDLTDPQVVFAGWNDPEFSQMAKVEKFKSSCENVHMRLADLQGTIEDPTISKILANIKSNRERICKRKRISETSDEQYILETTLLEWLRKNDVESPDEAHREEIQRLRNAVVNELVDIRKKLRETADLLNQLERFAEEADENWITALPPLRAACEQLNNAFSYIEWPFLIDILKHYCEEAQNHLRKIPLENATNLERAESAQSDLSVLCEAICGPGVELLATAFNDGDHEKASSVTAQLVEFVRVAHERLVDLLTVYGLDRDSEELAKVVCACQQFRRVLETVEELLAQRPSAPLAEHLRPIVCEPSSVDPGSTLNLDDPEPGGLANHLLKVLDPRRTVHHRAEARIDGMPTIWEREDPLNQIVAAPEFPQPMYEPLKDLSQEYFMPGAGDLSQDSVCVLETNPAAVEAYLVGLSHEMARELLWHGYPTDRRGTYFRQFWESRGQIPKSDEEQHKDSNAMDPIHKWDPARGLGKQIKGAGGTLVLILRGELLDRYPNTVIYAAKARPAKQHELGERVPDLPDPASKSLENNVKHPIFRGRLEPDIAFFGFDLTKEAAFGTETSPELGWFFVLEEPPGEPRFGFDIANSDSPAPSDWSELTWAHLQDDDPYVSIAANQGYLPPWKLDTWNLSEAMWGKNGAHMAKITWQRPFRIAIHADDMLPEDTK
jgi:hypothetical protein